MTRRDRQKLTNDAAFTFATVRIVSYSYKADQGWAAATRAGIMFTGNALASELTGIATMLIRSAYLIVLAGCVLLVVLAVAPAVCSAILTGTLLACPSARPVRPLRIAFPFLGVDLTLRRDCFVEGRVGRPFSDQI